jgi:ATP-dependent DNA helicase RecG
LQIARDAANEVLDEDPQLLKPENQVLKTQLRRLLKSQVDWSAIS